MYWWHLLSVNKIEMISKVYTAQKCSAISGDWVKLLDKDKELFDIKLTDNEVAEITKSKFKSYIKKKTIELSIENLSKLKKQNSKSKELDVSDMNISQYLIDNRISKQERSKTLLVKENLKNAYFNNDMLCELCKLFPCTQTHILQCPIINVRTVQTIPMYPDIYPPMS